MKPITSKEISTLLNYTLPIFDTTIKEISTDSRKIDPNTLFVAIKGENFDGHDFIEDVIKKGAPLVITERKIENIDPKHQIIVPNTLKAFGLLAHYNRSFYKGTLIALTGSSGKTTTKELLKSALSVYGTTYATTGNFNNHIGVPRSLLDIDMSAPFAIIEMGMSALKEIEYLTKLATPDIALITNVYPMHIEFLKTLENIAIAKSEIFEGLNPNGIAVYNNDTSHTDIIKNKAKKYTNNIHTYSITDTATLSKLSLIDNAPHCKSNALAVLKIIELLGLDISKAIPTINNFSALDGRGKKHHLKLNNKNLLLIDDSYSGQPEAMKLAINSLNTLKTNGRKIALIGKMAELGDYTKKAHQEIGEALNKTDIDIVIGVCEETKDMLNILDKKITQYYFPNIEQIPEFLTTTLLRDNDTILIKGAHYSSAVYKVAKYLIGNSTK